MDVNVDMAANLAHRTVLLQPAVDALLGEACATGVYIDGTFGRGGHSREILRRLLPSGRLLAFDKDPQAIAVAKQLQASDARFTTIHRSFACLDDELTLRGITEVQGVLLDLGISSPQIDQPERGFSFRQDGPLDMRMDPTRGVPLAQWLATASLEEIKKVICEYGEERFAVQIAQALVARRAQQPISRTRELAALVADAIGARGRAQLKKKDRYQDPATRTFQALRIYINQELTELEQGLAQAMQRLAHGGRLVVISFHSLEDRIVKGLLRQYAHPSQPPRRLPIKACDLPKAQFKLLGKRMPDANEVAFNPRARSAVMRCAEKI